MTEGIPKEAPRPGTDAGEISGIIGEEFRLCDDTGRDKRSTNTDGSGSSSSSSNNLTARGRNLLGQDQMNENESPNMKYKRLGQAAKANKRPKASDFFEEDEPNIPSMESSTPPGAGKTRKREDSLPPNGPILDDYRFQIRFFNRSIQATCLSAHGHSLCSSVPLYVRWS